MKPIEVKEYYGSLYRFRKDTGMAHSSLANWLNWGYVPIKSQYRLQELTNGKLKAEWGDSK